MLTSNLPSELGTFVSSAYLLNGNGWYNIERTIFVNLVFSMENAPHFQILTQIPWNSSHNYFFLIYKALLIK